MKNIKELFTRLARHEQHGDCPPIDADEAKWREEIKKYNKKLNLGDY